MNSTKAVIIDDDLEEAFSIIAALSRMKIASIVFNGDPELLPSTPMNGIRLLFLDFNLGDTDGADPKTIMSKVYAVVKKVIPPQSPYLLFVWSKKTESEGSEEILTDLTKFLVDNDISPVVTLIDLDKGEFLKKGLEEKTIFIDDKLKLALSGSGIFNTFLLWENLVSSSAAQSIDMVMSSAPKGTGWDKEISKIIYQLGKAYLADHLDSADVEGLVKASLHTLNGVLVDTIEGRIRKAQGLDKTPISDETIGAEVISKINFSLLVIEDHSIQALPGNLYEDVSTTAFFEKDYWEKVFNDCFDNKEKIISLVKKINIAIPECQTNPEPFVVDFINNIFSQTRFFFLEISPVCDYAQKKQRTNRLLPVLCFPDEYLEFTKFQAEYLYCPKTTFFVGGKVTQFIFDLRRFKSSPCADFVGKDSNLRLRNELLVVIQQKLSNHIARPGFTSL